MFRDEESYRYALETLKLSPAKIALATDLIFFNPIWQKAQAKANLDIPSGRYKAIVGVNFLSDIPDWIDRSDYIKTVQGFVKTLLKEGNYLIFLPFQHTFNTNNDTAFMAQTLQPVLKDKSGYKFMDQLPLDQAVSYFRQIDIFVGMRFHALLLALINRTPFLAIAYDTKCWRLIEEVNYRHGLKLENLDLKSWLKHYHQLEQQSAAARLSLDRIANNYYKKAQACLAEIAL